jgi:hypothetical protein
MANCTMVPTMLLTVMARMSRPPGRAAVSRRPTSSPAQTPAIHSTVQANPT